MEADWAVETGGPAPVIEVFWEGWIDLRDGFRDGSPAIAQVVEAARLPALAEALRNLNAPQSPVWTSKCDLWPIVPSDLPDPDEMDAHSEEVVAGLACYIDCLPRHHRLFPTLGEALRWARQVVVELFRIPCRSSRVDLVIRRAIGGGSDPSDGFGVTAYISGCGMDAARAERSLSEALRVFAGVVAASAIQPTAPATE